MDKRCPVCGKPTDQKFRPFCGARCADIDLGRWFTEGYAVPGKPDEPGLPGEDADA
jgi:endogenous inhibitor of DNA gyrase (YacG/DUF329 family)